MTPEVSRHSKRGKSSSRSKSRNSLHSRRHKVNQSNVSKYIKKTMDSSFRANTSERSKEKDAYIKFKDYSSRFMPTQTGFLSTNLTTTPHSQNIPRQVCFRTNGSGKRSKLHSLFKFQTIRPSMEYEAYQDSHLNTTALKRKKLSSGIGLQTECETAKTSELKSSNDTINFPSQIPTAKNSTLRQNKLYSILMGRDRNSKGYEVGRNSIKASVATTGTRVDVKTGFSV